MELTLITESQIQNRIRELANEIRKDYKDSSVPTFVCILRGSFMFFSDLIKELEMDLKVEFIQVSSYEDSTVSGNLTFKTIIDKAPESNTIFLVDDIIDTGKTFQEVKKFYENLGVKNVKTISLICRNFSKSKVDYYGFEIGDEWIFGYGLDLNGLNRNLKEIKYLEHNID